MLAGGRKTNMTKQDTAKHKPGCPTTIGGQAVIEGVMMRGKTMYAMAVRDPKGNIVTRSKNLAGKDRARIWKWPIFRGVMAFVDSLIIGTKILTESAEIAASEEDSKKKTVAEEQLEIVEMIGKKEADVQQPEEFASEAHEKQDAIVECDSCGTKNKLIGGIACECEHCGTYVQTEPIEYQLEDVFIKPEKKQNKGEAVAFFFAIVFSIAVTFGLFFALPVFLSGLLQNWLDAETWALGIFDGVIRILIFVTYIILISLLKDVRRVFQYHGAEHKTISCFENGDELTVENVRRHTRIHKRCGTSFLFFVMLISMVVFMFLSVDNGLIRLASRLVLVPFIAGASYEVIRWAGRSNSLIVRILSWPGIMLQRLTTKEPDDSQIEVAITAMKEVLAREGIE